MSLLVYLEFTINFFVIFSLLISIIGLIASVFKTKDYSLEIIFLGMISFCILLGFNEFMQLTITSYRLNGNEIPLSDSIISEMFSLMASMLIFGVAITKNKLQKVRLGRKK